MCIGRQGFLHGAQKLSFVEGLDNMNLAPWAHFRELALHWSESWTGAYYTLTIAGTSSSWFKENRRHYVPSSKKTRSSSERVAMRLCLFDFFFWLPRQGVNVIIGSCECFDDIIRSDHAIMMSHIRITENTSNWTTSLKSWYRKSLK